MISALVAAFVLGAAQTAAIDAAVESERARQHVPAVSLAIARGGRLLYAKGYGDADPGQRIAAEPRTVYAIGSVTKQFTAALVMKLVERGRIKLDAKLADYLPDAPHAREIEVRYLLDQRSGLPDYLADPFVVGYIYKPDVAPAQLVALIADRPLDFVPGTKWAYSNTNYALAGMLIERVTGMRYERALEVEILDPLRLRATTAPAPPAGPLVAAGMSWDPALRAERPVQRWSPQVAYAAGMLNSNVLDLVAWDAAFFGGNVVSEASVREMTTAPVLASGGSDGYAFGWILGTAYGRREIWHNGGIPGFAARNAYFPEGRIAIAVLANAMEFDAGPIVREALAAAAGLSQAERAPYDHPAPAPGEDPKISALARAQFDAIVNGSIDAAAYTAAMNGALTPALLAQVRAALASLGPAIGFTFVSHSKAEGFDTYVYKIDCAQGSVRETLSLDAGGAIGGLYFRPWEA